MGVFVLFTVPHEMKGCPPLKAKKTVQLEFFDKSQEMRIGPKPDQTLVQQKYNIKNTTIIDFF